MKQFYCSSFIVVALIFICHSGSAQNMARVYYNLDTLSAKGMHGRGASNDGDKIAANFLKQYFKRLGLNSLMSDSGFYQNFEYNINTFEEPISLSSNAKKYAVGKDYILHPSCGRARGIFNVIKLDSALIFNKSSLKKLSKNNLSKKALLIDSKWIKNKYTKDTELAAVLSNAGCVIEVVGNKLTASLSDSQFKNAWIQVKNDFTQTIPSKIRLNINPKLKLAYPTQNIVGMVAASVPTDSFLIITAHYDHLGDMGKNTYFPGAGDNGSGISMLIELMSYYSKPQHKPKYNMVFIAFAAEEAGLIGSRYFVENSPIALSKVKFLINLDLMGSGDEGMMVVNGAVHQTAFETLLSINEQKKYLPVIKKRGKAANSDHYWFSEQGVPAFFFYTLGGASFYHDIYDVPNTLTLSKFREVYRLIIDFMNTQ